MSSQPKTMPHPYEAYAGTATWSVVDRAIRELAENRDLEETTSHEHIVGYLCKALSAENPTEQRHKPTREELKSVIAAARAEYQARNPGRDPLEELLAERRQAALRGE